MSRSGSREFLVITALGIPLLFGALGATTFLDPDEGMYGSIAKEMAESSEWVTPRFNGVRYLNKPPLYFWLTAATLRAFGPSEWAVRLWSALPAFATAFFTWRLGNCLYGGYTGVLSALVLVSSIGVFRYTRVAATDFLLVFSVTLAVYGVVRHYVSVGNASAVKSCRLQLGSPWSVVFYLGMAFGVLSKGLIGVVFPLLTLALFTLRTGRLSTSREKGAAEHWSLLCSPLGFLLFGVVVLPWHVLAGVRNDGFFEFYILDNQFLRFLNSRAFREDDLPVGTVSFLWLTLVWFFPWSIFLPAAMRVGFPRLSLTASPVARLQSVVGLWAFGVIGFFSLSSSKLEHYFLPAIPPLSLMVGALWNGGISCPRSALAERWLRWCLAVGAGVGLALGLGLWYFSNAVTPHAVFAGLAQVNVYYRIMKEHGAAFPFTSLVPFVELLKLLGVGLALALPSAFIVWILKKPFASFAVLLGLASLICFWITKLDLLVESHHSSRAAASVLASLAKEEDIIVHEGSLEYSGGLPWYLGSQRLYVLDGREGSLDFGSRYPEATSFFLNRIQFQDLWNGVPRVFLVTRFPQESFIRRMSPERVFLIGQYGTRWLYSNRRP